MSRPKKTEFTSQTGTTGYTHGTVRISFNVSRALHKRLKSQVPAGVRSIVLEVLTEALVRASEKRGRMVFGAILDRRFSLVLKPKKVDAETE